MRYRLVILAVATLLLCVSSAEAAKPGPNGIHLAWGQSQDASTSISVAWTGAASLTTPARVEYGPTSSYGSVAEAETWLLAGENPAAYQAYLNGLQPNTTYHYRVVQDDGASPDSTFRTASQDSQAAFTVAAWGDQGVFDPENPLSSADGNAPEETTRLAMKYRPTFHVIPGDLSYANGYPSTWDRYFDMLEPYAAKTPFMSAVGNHEREGGQGFLQYDTRLPMPSASGVRWYAFRYAHTLFVALDTEHACNNPTNDPKPGHFSAACEGGPHPEQLAFLEATLAQARGDANVKWIVVYHHYPLWSNGRHGSNLAIRGIWGPLYDKYHVNLVIQAHDHMYERTKTLVGEQVSPNGTTYVTVGVGGASHYDFRDDTPPEWEAARDNTHYGALFLNFTADAIVAEFRATDDDVIDEWALHRDAAGRAFQGDAVTSSPPVTSTSDSTGSPTVSAMAALLAVLVVLWRRRS